MTARAREVLDHSRPDLAANQAIGIAIERFGRATAEHFRSFPELNKVAGFRVNPEYAANNLLQQAGFSAEIKHVANNNANTIIAGTGDMIARTDNLGHVNHTTADVVVIDVLTGLAILNDDGAFASASQMKVYKDFTKYRDLYSTSDYQKYQGVDLLIPSDKFETVLSDWDNQLARLEKQRDTLLQRGDPQVAAQKQQQIDALKDARSRARKSTVSSAQAMEARVSPRLSVAKDVLDISHRAGVESARMGGMIGGGISLLSNMVKVFQSKKELGEAAVDVAVDTGTYAASAYAAGAAATALAGTMQTAGHEVIRNLGKSNAPATIVQAAALLGKSFVQLASGKITAEQFAGHINKEGVALASSMAGSNLGAIIGTMALPGAGTLIGGMIGGMTASMLSGSLYAELQRSIQSLHESDQLRKQTEAMCQFLLEQHRRYQQELNATFEAFFAEKRTQLQSGFDEIATALTQGRSIHTGLEKLASSLGKELAFSSSDAFVQHLRGGKALEI